MHSKFIVQLFAIVPSVFQVLYDVPFLLPFFPTGLPIFSRLWNYFLVSLPFLWPTCCLFVLSASSYPFCASHHSDILTIYSGCLLRQTPLYWWEYQVVRNHQHQKITRIDLQILWELGRIPIKIGVQSQCCLTVAQGKVTVTLGFW